MTAHVSLKEYVDRLRESDKNALDAALASLDKRLDGLNELRKIVSDQQATLVTRAEFDAIRKGDETRGSAQSAISASTRAAIISGLGIAISTTIAILVSVFR